MNITNCFFFLVLYQEVLFHILPEIVWKNYPSTWIWENQIKIPLMYQSRYLTVYRLQILSVWTEYINRFEPTSENLPTVFSGKGSSKFRTKTWPRKDDQLGLRPPRPPPPSTRPQKTPKHGNRNPSVKMMTIK